MPLLAILAIEPIILASADVRWWAYFLMSTPKFVQTDPSPNAKRLLELYELFPFHRHPLWLAIVRKELTEEQVILAECQHYLRTKAGQRLRKEAMEKCLADSSLLWEAIIETYLEECTEEDGTPTHLDLIKRMVLSRGLTQTDLDKLKNTPGNIAAISLYSNISDRGAGCHIIGAGMVEYYYSTLCPKIFESYTSYYRFTEFEVETYKIHGPMDQVHAQRAIAVVDEAIKIHGWDLVESSVRDAFVATSLHYDGMLQAATGVHNFWNGKS
jgi:pyrroloquinoline quinone (PQQ) biosynthesis protein C